MDEAGHPTKSQPLAPPWWPVRYPSESPAAPGGVEWANFEVSFIPKTAAEIEEIMRFATAHKLTDAQLVARALEGWRGKLGQGCAPGSPPVPFTVIALQLACVIEPCFVAGVMRAFMEYAAHLVPSRAKSVARSLARVNQLESRGAKPR